MIATTLEQSKRLMAAGLNVKSADMSYIGEGATIDPAQDKYTLGVVPFCEYRGKLVDSLAKNKFDRLHFGLEDGSIDILEDMMRRAFPAWSLSALWDILHRRDKTYEFATNMSSEGFIEFLVNTICYRLNQTR